MDGTVITCPRPCFLEVGVRAPSVGHDPHHCADLLLSFVESSNVAPGVGWSYNTGSLSPRRGGGRACEGECCITVLFSRAHVDEGTDGVETCLVCWCYLLSLRPLLSWDRWLRAEIQFDVDSFAD